jgi:hypothetical protein
MRSTRRSHREPVEAGDCITGRGARWPTCRERHRTVDALRGVAAGAESLGDELLTELRDPATHGEERAAGVSCRLVELATIETVCVVPGSNSGVREQWSPGTRAAALHLGHGGARGVCCAPRGTTVARTRATPAGSSGRTSTASTPRSHSHPRCRSDGRRLGLSPPRRRCRPLVLARTGATGCAFGTRTSRRRR